MELTQRLVLIAQTMGWRYTVRGEPIAPEQVFSQTGLLPALLRRADQLCSFCLGYGLGLTFERAESATLGVAVQLDTAVPISLRMLCVTDVLFEFLHAAPSPDAIPLDDLMQD